RGTANGVPNMKMIGPEQLLELEPNCSGVAALHVPGTGIVDYKVVANKYKELIERAGGTIVLGCDVQDIRQKSNELLILTSRGDVSTRNAINCAGLFSDRIRRMAGDLTGPKIVPFRGEYYEIVPARQKLV